MGEPHRPSRTWDDVSDHDRRLSACAEAIRRTLLCFLTCSATGNPASPMTTHIATSALALLEHQQGSCRSRRRPVDLPEQRQAGGSGLLRPLAGEPFRCDLERSADGAQPARLAGGSADLARLGAIDRQTFGARRGRPDGEEVRPHGIGPRRKGGTIPSTSTTARLLQGELGRYRLHQLLQPRQRGVVRTAGASDQAVVGHRRPAASCSRTPPGDNLRCGARAFRAWMEANG